MERGSIPVETLSGGIDLYTTLESGQSYLWRREDGRMYDGLGPSTWGDDPPWYCTVVDGEVIRVRQHHDRLEWQGTTDVEPTVRRLLRLDDDLETILDAAPSDPMLEAAYEYARGLRIVADQPFGTLISFICSPQMRVSRIHDMVTAITRTYGDAHQVEGRTYHAVPRPEALAATTEADLRELGLGYRAPYVQQTAELVAADEAHPEDARPLAYEEARDYLSQFVGVGEKVADCVLLFSLDHLEAVPLDTWIRTAIEEYYPECAHDDYAETSRAIRERFGGKYAGYIQTYVFHHLRTNEDG
jgi:N-glycosylase/DNA lyase